MSTETIAVIISGATLLVSFVAAFGWMIHRVDARIHRLDDRLSERIETLERELVEVKIGLARIEGPPRRLITSR